MYDAPMHLLSPGAGEVQSEVIERTGEEPPHTGGFNFAVGKISSQFVYLCCKIPL